MLKLLFILNKFSLITTKKPVVSSTKLFTVVVRLTWIKINYFQKKTFIIPLLTADYKTNKKKRDIGGRGLKGFLLDQLLNVVISLKQKS